MHNINVKCVYLSVKHGVTKTNYSDILSILGSREILHAKKVL